MWFKKKKVIDLTAGNKIPQAVKAKLEAYKDLTKSQAAQATQSGDSSALGFLGSLANSASDSLGLDKLSPQHFKVRIEDIDYKIDNLRTRLDKFLERLELAERKIDRLER